MPVRVTDAPAVAGFGLWLVTDGAAVAAVPVVMLAELPVELEDTVPDEVYLFTMTTYCMPVTTLGVTH